MTVASLGEHRQDRLMACAAGAFRVGLLPLRVVIAAPIGLFLAALLAMLFGHPDVPFHQINRWTFGLLLLAVVARGLATKSELFVLERASWPMISLMLVILASMVGRPLDADTWGIFGAKYLIPIVMFHLAKLVFIRERDFRHLEILAFLVLAYLSFTSIAFLAGARFLVFPQFILDPGIGYHADRARGPFLQAVANGVSLNLLGILVWHAYQRGSLRGWKTGVLLASVPVAIMATLTRAVWLSFAGSVVTLLCLSKNRRVRLAFTAVALVAIALLGIVVSMTSLGDVLSDRFEESAPVDFRKAVYAGGWQMFLDRPLTGWGFHQMPATLPRYVSEFQDKVLYPHNTYLEILAENGLLGFAFYAWMMWELWRLGRAKNDAKMGFIDRTFRRLWPVFLAVYWINAAVVVMSYHFVNALLFTVAGVLAGQKQRVEAQVSC